MAVKNVSKLAIQRVHPELEKDSHACSNSVQSIAMDTRDYTKRAGCFILEPMNRRKPMNTKKNDALREEFIRSNESSKTFHGVHPSCFWCMLL
jgi:hypothetical protein